MENTIKGEQINILLTYLGEPNLHLFFTLKFGSCVTSLLCSFALCGKRLEGQYFTKLVENTNITDCIASP